MIISDLDYSNIMEQKLVLHIKGGAQEPIIVNPLVVDGTQTINFGNGTALSTSQAGHGLITALQGLPTATLSTTNKTEYDSTNKVFTGSGSSNGSLTIIIP